MSNPNPTCSTCRHTRNALNGLYCDLLQRYVEHSPTQQCTNISNP